MRTGQMPKLRAAISGQSITRSGVSLDATSRIEVTGHGPGCGHRSQVSRPRTSWSARLILALLIGLTINGRSHASGIYNATYIGNSGDIQQDNAKVSNNQTGLSYAFATTTTPFTDANSRNLPQSSVLQGVTNPLPETYSMNVTSINNSGTVIGSLPSGLARSDPWASVTLGYSIKSSDGQYSPFVSLIAPDPQINQPNPGQLYLSQSNQILINNPKGNQLFDLNTGTYTSIDQLIPPTILKGLSNGYQVQGIDDRGDILAIAATAVFSGRFEYSEFILTPTGLAAPTPTPTPEPSTWVIFGLISGVLAVRTMVKQS